jgi:hypothetical protein
MWLFLLVDVALSGAGGATLREKVEQTIVYNFHR